MHLAGFEALLSSMDQQARAEQIVLCWPPGGQGAIGIGGVLLWGEHFQDRDGLAAKIEALQARAVVPLLVAADVEGGVLDRLGLGIPSARELGTLPDAEIERWGQRAGEAMRELGIHLDLAPVLDVSHTGAIGRKERSFSDDPRRAASAGAAFARGLHAAGVGSVGKHFPGLGELPDTDRGRVSAPWSHAELQQHVGVFVEVGPALSGLMMSNAVYASVDPHPAYASSVWVERATALAGLVLTDDLAAARVLRLSPQPALDAFLAGADLLVTSEPPERRDIASPIASLARQDHEADLLLEDAASRVLHLKAELGLLR